jgi:hypothetical protein
MTDNQIEKIKKIEAILLPIAEQHGFKTEIIPINGNEILIKHIKITSQGYDQVKEILIDENINLEELKQSFV